MTWTIDAAMGVVRFDLQAVGRTGWRSRFDTPAFEMPLAPSLASVSVAPAGPVVGEFEMKWPRVESSDHLMTVGSGTTLQQALQHATLELHHWLDDDFGLSERAVNIFVGQAIEYEVAAVGDAEFTVVAKVRKSYLPRPIATP